MLYSGNSSRLSLGKKALLQVGNRQGYPQHMLLGERSQCFSQEEIWPQGELQRWVSYSGKGRGRREQEPLFILVRAKDIIGMYADPNGRVFDAVVPHNLSCKRNGWSLFQYNSAYPVVRYRSLPLITELGHCRVEGGWACFRRRGNSLCKVI